MNVDLYLNEAKVSAKELNRADRKELTSMLKSPLIKKVLGNVLVEAQGKEQVILNTNLTQDNVVEINGKRGEAEGMNRAIAAIVEMTDG